MSALVFAVVSSEPGAFDALSSFCDTLGRGTGLRFEARVVPNNAELREGVAAGGFDVVWASPLVAIELEDQGVASSVVVIRRSARAGYYSALFSRADFGVTKVEELQGVRAAWVSKDSASGYFVPRWHMRSMGISLATAFRSELQLGTHEAVTRAVIDGTADVGATHASLDPVSGKLASAPWLTLTPKPPAMRVLLLVGPIPGDVIAVARRVPAPARRQLVAALVAMRGAELSRSVFEASQFDPVPDGHLDLLRRLARFSETKA